MKMFLCSTIFSLLFFTGPACAWWGGGHQILTRAAVKSVPSLLPSFFIDNASGTAIHSIDPDAVKNPLVPYVKNTEGPEHFFDMELLGDSPQIASTRYAYIAWCCRMGKVPDRIGFLPYAIEEWTGRLAVAFAEYRRWPKSQDIKNTCVLYAGYLSHYAEDACQPLHVTVNFDGKTGPDGKSPRTGIHDKIDALIENARTGDAALITGNTPSSLPLQADSLFAVIMTAIKKSAGRIDEVYKMEPYCVPAADSTMKPQACSLAVDLGRTAVAFTASLYLAAWNLSSSIQIDNWLIRIMENSGEGINKDVKTPATPRNRH
jgi:hypothetical protein